MRFFWTAVVLLLQWSSFAYSKCPHVEYEGKCFSVVMAPTSAGVTYPDAELICKARNANPANIYSKDHFDSIMAHLRATRSDFYHVYLGMQYDGSTLKNYDGSVAEYCDSGKWRAGDPITLVADNVPMNRVAIDVYPDPLNSGNGMLTSYEGWKKKGVVCEMPDSDFSTACLDNVAHYTRGDQCFYVKMAEPTSDSVNYAEADELCMADNAYPANIYDSAHYTQTMNHLRAINSDFNYVYLGMDYSDQQLKYYDGSAASYAKWRTGDPVTEVASGEDMNKVAIDVFPDVNYYGNGMLTSAANWGKKGVICEQYTKRCDEQENHIMHDGSCFWVEMTSITPGVNFEEAETLCRVKQGTPANIYDDDHYNKAMKLLRKVNNAFYYVFLGMGYEDSQLKYYDGTAATYANWRQGDPVTEVAAGVPMIKVALDIYPDASNVGNGMLTSATGWEKKGVLCEQKSRCVDKKNHVIRGSSCFWVEMTSKVPGVNYQEADQMCHDKGATPANIYDSEHYMDIMSLLRKENDAFYYVYLGMQYKDHSLKYYDGSSASYANWRPGDPVDVVASGEKMSRVAIDVYPDASNSGNGMLTSAANWEKKGVVCEQKI